MRARSFAAAVLFIAAPSALAQRFRADDPIRRDADGLPVAIPRSNEVASAYDGLRYSLARTKAQPPRAVDVNTVDEVPDSSWFTNRMGARPMSVDELVRGPATTSGPDVTRPWMVISGKVEGVTRGFTVRDARDDVYFAKVDPKDWPHLATAVDVIGALFFHAFGYWVPENFIARIRPEDLRLDPDARFRGVNEAPRTMRADDLRLILADCPREPDGRIRVVASRALPGRSIGPFRYEGTRSDDPNDIFAHEDRRELRALHVFCAWLNHVDSSSHNTLDTYVGEPGHGHVRHNLIDWNGILGSGSISPREPWEGNEYVLPWSAMLKSAISAGMWDRPWRRVNYVEYPESGLLEAEFFQPERWKPYYPNPAHDRMRPDDALWATRIVMAFSDDAVRALVHTGEYSDPAAEAHLADTLIRRRDKVVAYYLDLIDPLTDFRRDRGELAFRNLGVEAGLAEAAEYDYTWFRFDNRTASLEPLGLSGTSAVPHFEVPARSDPFLMVRIRTRAARRPAWHSSVDVYVRRGRGVVGVDREIGPAPVRPDSRLASVAVSARR